MRRLTPGGRFALIVSGIALAFALLGAGIAWRVYTTEREHRIAATAQIAATAGASADRFLRDRLDTLSAIASAPTIRSGNVPAMLDYFLSLDPAGIGFGGGVGWVDRDGWVRAFTTASPERLPIYIGDREHVQSVLGNQVPYVGEAIVDRRNVTPILPFAVPTFDLDGRFSGLVVGSIRLTSLDAAAKEQRFGDAEIIIVDRSGNVIVHPQPFTDLVNVASSPLMASLTPGGAGVLDGRTGLTGRNHRVVAFASAPAGDWTVLVERSEDEIFGGPRRTLRIELGGVLILFLATVAGGRTIGQRINRSAEREAAAVAELELREARFRSLTEATAQVVWTVDPSGELREWRARWSALTGIPADQLDRETWLSYVHEADRVPGNEAWKTGIAEGRMIEFEQRVNRGDGTQRQYLVRAVPVREPDGRIREWVGVDVDVTERANAERAIAESEERYRALVEATSSVVWRTTADGTLSFGADAWERTTGQPPSEVGGDGWSEVFHPDDRERALEAWKSALESRMPFTNEVRLRQRDGSYRYFLSRAVPVFNADGSVREWIGTISDIHDRRRAEETLRETAERLSLALEAGQLDTWDWDVQADRVAWSETAEASIGPTPPTIGDLLQRIHPDDRDRVVDAIRRTLEERAPYEIEYRTTGVDGTERWLYVRGEAYHDEQGRPLRMLGVGLDITDRKNREALAHDFIASVAHDIKNPLTAVKAQAQLLRRRIKYGTVELESIDSALEMLDAGLTRMNRRIEELADVARLRAGRPLELRRQPTDLVALVRAMIESYQQATDRHTIALTTSEPKLIGDIDSGRIERVIDNLISNAIKYSPNGGTIEVDLSREAGDPGRACLRVADHGIGIPATDLPHIFERYRRASNSVVITGTGIGLAGSRLIVEQHGGAIDVASREGEGTVFSVTLPLAESAASVA